MRYEWKNIKLDKLDFNTVKLGFEHTFLHVIQFYVSGSFNGFSISHNGIFGGFLMGGGQVIAFLGSFWAGLTQGREIGQNLTHKIRKNVENRIFFKSLMKIKKFHPNLIKNSTEKFS